MTTTMTTARPGVPARVRIMGWLLGLMLLALTVVAVGGWRLLVSDVDDRINRGLEQEAKEFVDFVQVGRDPKTGQPVADAYGLIKAHLHNNQYPEPNEIHLAVLVEANGTVHVTRQGVQPVEVSGDKELIRRIVSAPESYGTTPTAAGDLRWAKVPLKATGQGQPSFVTAFFVTGMRASADQAIRLLLLVSLIGFLLAAGVSWVVAGRILAPIRTVRQAAAEITERDLTRRIPVHGKDDIAALAEQFNLMLDRLEQAFRTQRQFLDDASHELRTPITIVSGHLELMGDDPAERAEVVRLCTDELDRMNRIVQDLLLLAKAERPDFLRPAPVSLPELTSDIDAKVRALAPGAGCWSRWPRARWCWTRSGSPRRWCSWRRTRCSTPARARRSGWVRRCTGRTCRSGSPTGGRGSPRRSGRRSSTGSRVVPPGAWTAVAPGWGWRS